MKEKIGRRAISALRITDKTDLEYMTNKNGRNKYGGVYMVDGIV